MVMGKKLDEEKINQIKELLKTETMQPITVKEVAKKLNVSIPTVRKYSSEENEKRFVERTKKYKERTKEKRKNYMRKYMMDRYRKDPIFKRKVLDNTLRYAKEKRDKDDKKD